MLKTDEKVIEGMKVRLRAIEGSLKKETIQRKDIFLIAIQVNLSTF